jgi:AbrB family looped-hinge helix DNA binding protein
MKRTSRLQGNGKVTIPVQIRKKYYIEEGDLFEVIELENGVLLKPTKEIPAKKFKEIEKEQQK